MSNLNCSCPECGKKFHACGSCGLIYSYEYEYCSLECYQKTFKYEEKKKKLIRYIENAKNDIIKLDDLTYYIQEELCDDIFIFLYDKDVSEVWYSNFTRKERL